MRLVTIKQVGTNYIAAKNNRNNPPKVTFQQFLEKQPAAQEGVIFMFPNFPPGT